MSPMSPRDDRLVLRAKLEGRCTGRRLVELQFDPVRGSFDAAHLKEINRRIFQDLPGHGFTNVTPGEFRPAVPPGLDWIKSRNLETVTTVSCVAYSTMDHIALARLDKILKDANPTKLSKLKTADFTQVIARLYAEIDYIHPFRDGNSRTLRAFTFQLAKDSGYFIAWERFSRVPAGRDILYIACDLSVNKLALPHIQNFATKRDVTLTMDLFGGNRDLPELLPDAIRPSRAIAFEQLPEAEALAVHPELNEAFKMMRDAAQYFARRISAPDKQRTALTTVRTHVQEKLDKGETRNFRRPPDKQDAQEKSQETPNMARPGLERE